MSKAIDYRIKWEALKQHIKFQLNTDGFNPHSKKVLKTFRGLLATMKQLEEFWVSYRILPDMEQRNSQSTCNNCSQSITWNPQVVHSQTGRMTPLNEPWIPYTKPPSLHRCMTQKRPQHFLRKYNDASFFDQFPEWFLEMMGNKKKWKNTQSI